MHDLVTKRCRHLNFLQHEYVLHVRTPRVKLPDGSVRLVKPPIAGEPSGFTLSLSALMMAGQSPFVAVARVFGRVLAICQRYVICA